MAEPKTIKTKKATEDVKVTESKIESAKTDTNTTTEKTNKTKTTTPKFFSGTGRRKTSIASVWLYNEKGEIKVNGKLIADYFADSIDTLKWVAPFHSIGIAHPQAKFSATIKVKGGGPKGQLDAVALAIARSILKFDPESKAALRDNELLTRDSRQVERKKPFFTKARKKPQYSKR